MNNKLKSIEYFEQTNWKCPDKLHIEFYELTVTTTTSLRRFTSNTVKIKEFYIPEYNIGINNYGFENKKYNIILNAHSRYEEGVNKLYVNKNPKLLKTIELVGDDCCELFNLLVYYVKSHNMESTVNKLYELVNEKN